MLLWVALVALAAVAWGGEVRLRLEGCAPECEARVVVFDRRGNDAVFLAQSDGVVTMPGFEEAGLYWLGVSSRHWLYPQVQLVANSRGEVESCNVEGQELAVSSEGVFALPHGPAPELQEQEQPFSWWGLVSSPMVAMGLITVGMMIVLQLLISGMGSVDDIRRELRAEHGDEAKPKKLAGKKKTN